MRKQNLIPGAFALAALALTACSNELPVNGPQKVTVDEERFMAVTLSAPNAATTRGFENGTLEEENGVGVAGESYVYCLDFIFYDVNGNPTGNFTHLGEDEVKGLTFTTNTNGDNVERFCTSVVPVTLTQGDNLPAQVICIVNGNTEVVNKISALSLHDEDGGFRDITQAEFSRGGNFLMTNSVYYGQDLTTGQADQRLCATPINANTQLFSSRKAAQTAITNNTPGALVDIYVERVAAKVTMNLKKDNISNYILTNGDAEGDIAIKFVPEYWLMNAVDSKTYLTKRYGVDVNGVIDEYPEWSVINTALTTAGFNDWNSVPNHRSYWGTSPSYFADSFPLVSDQVFDPEANEGVVYDPYNTEHNKYAVNYFSYNSVKAGIDNEEYSEVRKQWKAVDADGSITNSVIYTRETTTPQKTINNITSTGNPAASVGSAVVLGHYEVITTTPAEEEGGTATTTSVQKTFYVDRNDGENGTYYGSMETARKALLDRQSILFIDEDGKNAVDFDDLSEANQKRFTVEHPKAAVRAKTGNPNVAGRLVTLQLTSVPESIYFYDATQSKFVPVTSANLDAVNAMLVQTGYLDMFYNGLGFFTVPIRHLNFKASSIGENGQYNWATMSVGELGIVRNHAYSMEVTSIKGLANGLRSEDQPIVPAKDTYNQYIAMRLNILAWNIVNKWTVDL